MRNGTGSSIRLLLAAILTFGGLAAIVIGIAMAIAPANDLACRLTAPCTSQPPVPAVADRVSRSATD
jgi:hypothetical protein